MSKIIEIGQFFTELFKKSKSACAVCWDTV